MDSPTHNDRRDQATDGTSSLLTYVVDGSGPPLVLLNGGLMTLRAWDPIVERLQARHAVVRCDFRGQLLTPGDPPPSLRDHASDVIAVLDHLGLDRVHLVGASFGALVGLVTCASFPARVQSLVAVTATDRVTPEMWASAVALQDAACAAAAGGDGRAVFDLMVRSTYSAAYRQQNDAMLAARREAVASLPRHWFASIQGLLDSLRGLDLGPLLPQVTCPVLVLAGGHDETFPVAHSQTLAARLSDARLRIVPDASHGLVLEQPDLVVESVVGFIEAASPRSGTDSGAAPAGE